MSIEKQGSGFQYQILTTADGSPSLRLWKDNQPPEAMHHLGGALAETMYIYDTALQECVKLTGKLRVLSVGLGLGYNEILAAARSFANSCPLYMESFESEADLRLAFHNWLHDHHAPEPFKSTYEKILTLIAHATGIFPEQLKQTLKNAEEQGQWRLNESLTQQTVFQDGFNCILFDAFSNGATPELWTEEFLNSFLQKAASRPCIFSTYAATGALKRSLSANDFSIELRPGFGGKRHSTWAIRSSA